MNSNLGKQWHRYASIMGLMAIMAVPASAADVPDGDWKPLGPETEGVSLIGSRARFYRITGSGCYYLTNNVSCIQVRPASTVKAADIPIEVTIDLRGHSVSNAETSTYQLIRCGQNDNVNVKTTCTLTNSSDKVSYLDGQKKTFNGAGRGILNNYSGEFHFDGGTNIVIRNCYLSDSNSNKNGYWGAGICNYGTFYMTGGLVGEAASTNKNGYCNYTADIHGGGIYNGQWIDTPRKCAQQTKFIMTGGSVQYCGCTQKHGGGISNQAWDSLFIVGGEGKGVVISHNKSPSGAGIMTGNTSTLILTNNVEISFNTATGTGNTLSGGGISVGSGGDEYGGGTNQLFIYGCNIVSNSAKSLGGGGIYMRGVNTGRGRIEMHGGRIAYNTTTGVGGGIHTQGPVLMTDGVIEWNHSTTNGGGVCISADDSDKDWVQAFTMLGGCIRNNDARDGGGVHTVNEVTISGGCIMSNTASQFGGGVCIEQRNQTTPMPFTLSGGTNAYNSAGRHGGGFFVRLAKKGKVCLENGIVAGNKAREQGGGFWYSGRAATNLVAGNTLVISNQAAMGGGFYAKDGANLVVDGGMIVDNVATNKGGGGFYITTTSQSDAYSLLVLCGGTVKQNVALGNEGNGGGFYAYDSNVKLTDDVDIEENRADANGGGLALQFIKGRNSLILENGTVAGNIAPNGNGGGFWISGQGSTASEISGKIAVRFNRAQNGGGMYLTDSARLKVTGGFICYNVAEGDAATRQFKTAYQGGDVKPLSGVGGGMYVGQGASDKQTTLSFPADAKSIGIYANIASNAADDVCGDCKYTKISNLPTAENMLLEQLGGALVTGWYEDYVPKDSKYIGYGTKCTNDIEAVERYRTSLVYGRNGLCADEKLKESGTDTKYLCLTLGYLFPVPQNIWITDHNDLGDGKFELRFQPTFTNVEMAAEKDYVKDWAETANEYKHMWLSWADSPEMLEIVATNREDYASFSTNVFLSTDRPDCTSNNMVWVKFDLKDTGLHYDGSLPTNTYYKIVVDSLVDTSQDPER